MSGLRLCGLPEVAPVGLIRPLPVFCHLLITLVNNRNDILISSWVPGIASERGRLSVMVCLEMHHADTVISQDFGSVSGG